MLIGIDPPIHDVAKRRAVGIAPAFLMASLAVSVCALYKFGRLTFDRSPADDAGE
jgi:hypothetical protein